MSKNNTEKSDLTALQTVECFAFELAKKPLSATLFYSHQEVTHEKLSLNLFTLQILTLNYICLSVMETPIRRLIRLFCLLSALTLALSGCTDEGNGVFTATEQPASDGSTREDSVPEFPALITLREDAAPLRLIIPVVRESDNTDTLSVMINQRDRDQYPALNIEFEPETLPPGVNQFTLTLSYALSVAPIKPLEMLIPVQISGGSELQQRLLTIQVEPTTAPDIYLLIGQSNMAGSSTHGSIMSQAGELDAPDPRIQQLNVTNNERSVFMSQNAFSNPAVNVGSPVIVTAQPPLHEVLRTNHEFKTGDQIGLALSFAKAALGDTDSTILLVPAAWGGTGFCGNKNLMTSWNTSDSSNPALGGTGLYHRAITRTDIALKQSAGILRGILWHQGETDAAKATCADQYAANLQQLVAALRQNISLDARGSAARGAESDIPFILGTLSVGSDKRGDFSVISAPRQLVDNAHRSIADLVGHAGYSNNDDLVPPAYPCGDTSCIHFGAAAYREMGQRYYQSLKRVINQ